MGLFDVARTLFGGPGDSRLSEDENRAAQNQGLITAGLNTLLAQGPDGVSPSTLQALSLGALQGREAGGVARETAVGQNQQEQIQALVDSGGATPEVLQGLFMQAVANGDTDMARALSEVLKAMTGGAQRARRTSIASIEGRQVLVDLDTGAKLDLGASTSTEKPSYIRGFSDETEEHKNREAMYTANADGSPGRFVMWTDKATDNAADAENRGMVALMSDSAAGLDRIGHEMAEFLPSLVGKGIPFIADGANWLLSAEWSPFQNEDAQKAVNDGLNFISTAVRILSGKQMTEQETRRYYRSFLPEFGDGPEVQAQKSRKRNLLVQAIARQEADGASASFVSPTALINEIESNFAPEFRGGSVGFIEATGQDAIDLARSYLEGGVNFPGGDPR